LELQIQFANQSANVNLQSSIFEGSLIVYQGRVFSVEVDKARFQTAARSTWRSCIIPLRRPFPMQDDDHVILIRQYRHSIRREIWNCRRKRGCGESAEAAAARECEEEIALAPGGCNESPDCIRPQAIATKK